MDASALADPPPSFLDGYRDKYGVEHGGLVDPYRYPNIATDIGPSVEDLIPTDWDSFFKNVEEARGKLQKIQGPEVLARGQMLGADRVSSAGVRGFGTQKSPYAAPSYLTGSVDYNKMVAKMMEGLLKQRIRKVDIRTLV